MKLLGFDRLTSVFRLCLYSLSVLTALQACEMKAQADKETISIMNEEKLDSLFAALKITEDESLCDELESRIWEIWMDSEDDEVDRLMDEGVEELTQHEYTEAIKTFSKIIELMPEYAEGWNKRATAYYLRGDYKASLDDIKITLDLESRHFGAISGLISILSTIGDEWGTLRALNKLKRILPHEPGLKEQIESLELQLGLKKT